MSRKHFTISLPLCIFLFVRVPLLLALPFDGLRGYGDLIHFYNLAFLPGLPFFNYWIEFPPGFAFLNELIFAFAGGVEHIFTYLFVFLLLAADIGNIILFQRIEKLLYPNRSLPSWQSLIYAALVAGLPYAWWYFDSLPIFFTLLAIYLFLSNRKDAYVGTAVGLGMVTKLFPILIIPALVRALPIRRSITIATVALAILMIPILFLYAVSPDFTQATLSALFSRGSLATVWAIIDGNYTAGGFGPLIERLDPAYADISTRNPPVISPMILLAIFGVAGLFLFIKARLDTPIRMLAFYGITMIMYFLCSQAWSPQWVQYLVPICLLTLPLSPGLLMVGALVLVNLLEWPILLSRGFFDMQPLTILLRAFLMILLGILFYQSSQVVEPTKGEASKLAGTA